MANLPVEAINPFRYRWLEIDFSNWVMAPLMLIVLTLAACGDPNKPYLSFAGGGFIFNYRIAEVNYGFIMRVHRALPTGAIIEAEFQNPNSPDPIVVRRTVQPKIVKYDFRTPALKGVEADKKYQVTVRLLEKESHRVIATYSKFFVTNLDQSVLPDIAPTFGPGYQRNPQLDVVEAGGEKRH